MADGEIRPSVYQAGAHDGFALGALFILCFVSLAVGISHGLMAPMALSSLVAIVGVPFALYWMLRRRFVADGCKSAMATITLHGIVAMVCGNLIMGVCAYVYMRFVDPFFIVNMAEQAISQYSDIGSEAAIKLAASLQAMIDQKLLPSPISCAFSWMWFGSFFGSMLALAESMIIRATTANPSSTNSPKF